MMNPWQRKFFSVSKSKAKYGKQRGRKKRDMNLSDRQAKRVDTQKQNKSKFFLLQAFGEININSARIKVMENVDREI